MHLPDTPQDHDNRVQDRVFYDEWLPALAAELASMYGEPVDDVMKRLRDAEDAYREMYDDGLSPSEARSEEYDAACWAAA